MGKFTRDILPKYISSQQFKNMANYEDLTNKHVSRCKYDEIYKANVDLESNNKDMDLY